MNHWELFLLAVMDHAKWYVVICVTHHHLRPFTTGRAPSSTAVKEEG